MEEVPNMPATRAACPASVASAGAGAVVGRGGGSASWSSRAAATACTYWTSASAVATHA
jgi:hypothetical protein